MNDIGKKIKEYRDSIKMTQADFASRLGVTGAAVSSYENGTRLPSYEVLVKIANILCVTTDALLGRKDIGSIVVDITGLTHEQRMIIRRTVEIFEGYNHHLIDKDD